MRMLMNKQEYTRRITKKNLIKMQTGCIKSGISPDICQSQMYALHMLNFDVKRHVLCFKTKLKIAYGYFTMRYV